VNFDLREVPFSRFGSYLAFSELPAGRAKPPGLYFRHVHGAGQSQIFRLDVLRDGKPVAFKEIGTPAVLRLEAPGGRVEICIPENRVVRIRGQGVGLRLTLERSWGDNALPAGPDRWRINSYCRDIKLMLTLLHGRLVADCPWRESIPQSLKFELLPDPKTSAWECALEEYQSEWPERGYPGSFEGGVRSVEGEFRQYLRRTASVPRPLAEARRLAAYLNWSSIVAPRGLIRRPGMFMSKNWMTNIWSWDHCFNGMALVYGNPAMAWDQWMVMFDQQDELGALPDSINTEHRTFNYCKPPVHGWALGWMMKRTRYVDKKRLKEAYGPLCRWTDWWLKYRDDDRDGIPQYNHGNDSGWDNCTAFDNGAPVEGPDLSAFLVRQMDVLSDVAARLGRANDARRWHERADRLLAGLIAHSWRGDRFVAPRDGDHRIVAPSNSLFVYLPIVLGRRLPPDIRRHLVAGLKSKDRLTKWGLATESPYGPLYEPDGYWRGPIWAPTTLLVVDGLHDVGEKDLARLISRRFCRMCARYGFFENFDALTGKGLRDPAYTWTSSVFLILAHQHMR
jgi:hypothetical protein